eukprot:TRINITY_DN3041_c0_g1_i1.p1 TRINITY_DN3041_c0_g1~~TRINITY_DN3041_c0_g1_i1.p1  ORF type:complete len:532 (+),score=95.15 TRINITY_DN3041_c0_g1_i1:96-1691(+)
MRSRCWRPFRCGIVACFATRNVVAASRGVDEACEGCSFEASALSLLQVSANMSTKDSGSSNTTTGPACSELENHGSYFSVTIEVGTPPQPFAVVADTGSDAVIVPSCLCQDAGDCSREDRCFQGTERSSTFHVESPDEVPVVNMEFGSGSIGAAITSDVVSVGSVRANMTDGLLLMVARRLDITGPFEGILGLGQLQAEYSPRTYGMTPSDVATWDRPASHSQNREDDVGSIYGFLRQANVDRFSICFNDGSSPGILRLNTERQATTLPSVGTLHWGLNLRGMSVGAASAPVLFCGEDDDRECGAIPDSGTTVMLGPEDQLKQVFSGICEEWPRCATAAETEFPSVGKEEVFQLVLRRCEEWLNEESGLDELPSVHIHLGNADNSTRSRTIELSAWSYVFETSADQAEEHTKLLGNIGVSFARTPRQQEEKYVCAPAFGTSEYSSSSAGPVWIVGTPLFYEYVVGFDRTTTPPEISFSTELCGSCTEGINTPLSLAMEVEGRQRRSAEVMRTPRKIHGPLRINRYATHLPI